MELPPQLYSSSSCSHITIFSVIPTQGNLACNQQFFTLNHQCLTINEARAKKEYLQQKDVIWSLSYCLQSSITQINIFEDNLKQLWIQCHIKPHGHELEYNQYQNNFNRYISDNFQINCFQMTHQIQDQKPEIIMNAIQKYNEENNEVYIQYNNIWKYDKIQEYQLLVSIYLQRKIPYEQLIEKLKLHRNRISEIFFCQKYFQIKNEEQEKVWKHHTSKYLPDIKIDQFSVLGEYGNITKLVKMIENQLEIYKYYQLSFKFPPKANLYQKKINELNVFQNKLKQIGQKSKNSTIGLLKFNKKFEFFVICEPNQLGIIEANIQHDLIDNLDLRKVEANFEELLSFLELSKEEFQFKYEVIVVFYNAECFVLFGLSSSLNSIAKFIQPFKSYKIFFDDNLIFCQLKQQYQQKPFIKLPSKLEFEENKTIKIQCKQNELDECIAYVLTRGKDISKQINTLTLDLDQKAIKYLKKYSPQFIDSIHQNYQTSIRFNKFYQLIYGTGQPLKMKEEIKTIQLTNNGIFSLQYDALISLGQGNETIDQIVSNIKAMKDSFSEPLEDDNDSSILFQMPKNQKQYLFTFIFKLNIQQGNTQNSFNLFQKFKSLEIKSIAIISETERAQNIKQIIDFFFINNQTQIETVYIIEPDLVRLSTYESSILKNFKFSKESNREWELHNIYEFIKIDENLNKQINQIYDQFTQSQVPQKIQLLNQNSNKNLFINFDKQKMTLDSKQIRMKKLLNFDQVILSSFCKQELEEVRSKLDFALFTITTTQEIEVPILSDEQLNNFKNYLLKKCLSVNGEIECNQKVSVTCFENKIQKIKEYLKNISGYQGIRTIGEGQSPTRRRKLVPFNKLNQGLSIHKQGFFQNSA